MTLISCYRVNQRSVHSLSLFIRFLVHDALMSVRLSVHPSVCLGQACIVIIRCTLMQI